MSYGDEEDGEICWEVRDVAHKGSGEEGKDAATVNGRNAARCGQCFVEEDMGFGGVEFAAEGRWFVGDPVTVDRQ